MPGIWRSHFPWYEKLFGLIARGIFQKIFLGYMTEFVYDPKALDLRASPAEFMMSYFQQQQAAAESRGKMEQQPLAEMEPEVEEPSAFNLTVDPGFLASLQQGAAGGTVAQGISVGTASAGGTTVVGGSAVFPPLPGLNISIPEQREWLLLQAQRALLKQAGDKLAPAELNQLNEILKAQFRQMFPSGTATIPGLLAQQQSNQAPDAGGGGVPVAPAVQPAPAMAAGGASGQQPGKRKVPGAPPPPAQQANKMNLESAMKDLKNLQLQDGKLAILQKGMREAYLEGMQAREEFEKMKKQAAEMSQHHKNQQHTQTAQEKFQVGTERGTQTTLTLQQNIQAGAASNESRDTVKSKTGDAAGTTKPATAHIVDVFPLQGSGGAGGAAGASFNFQLPPPPPPTQGKQQAKAAEGRGPEPIYATPTTVHQVQPTVGKANVSTQASLPPATLPAQTRSQTTRSETNAAARRPNNNTAAAAAAAKDPQEKEKGAGESGKDNKQVDLNSQTESNHDTALTLACAGGHDELVLLLIQRGADLEHRDKKGFTPLILAATAGHAGVVDLLLAHGGVIEAQSERTKDTALSLACSGGRKDVVDILLKKGANKEHRNVSDYTPLSLAASGGYVDIIQLLLNYGAEINSRTGSKLGISPLMLAAMNGHAQAVKLLLERGSDINAQIETNRNTALTLACFQGRHEVVKLLLDYRANVEHRAKTGLTPLMEAASGGYVEVGRVLLHYGADPNAAPVPSSRDTALTIAADKGHHKFVDLLLHHCAAVDARNKKGCTSLWLACHGGHLEAVQTLVRHGGDVDANDNRKVTPLMAAFRRGNAKVVKWLVRHVNQFPSDTECARFITTITDKELLVKSRQCSEVIVAAKDRQAAEANKAAATLLLQLEEEEKMAETRRQAKQRQKEKKKAKRQAKKAAQKPDEQHDEKDEKKSDESEGEESGGRKSKSESPPSPSPTPAPKAVPEVLTEEEDEEDDLEDKEEREASPKPVRGKKGSRGANRSAERNRKTEPNNNTVQDSDMELRVPAIPPEPETFEEDTKRDKNAVSPRGDGNAAGNEGRRQGYGPRSHGERRQRGFRTRGGVNRNGAGAGGGLGTPGSENKRVSPVPPGRGGASKGATGRGGGEEQWTEQSEWSRAERRRGGQAKAQAQQQHRKHEWTNRNQQSAGGQSQLIIQQEPDPPTGHNGDWREATKKKPNKLVVSSHAIARVIGRGGQNINAIREATGAHIEVEKQQPRREQQDRHITIRGSSDASRQAWLMINGLIQDPELPVVDIIRKIRVKDKSAVEQYSTGQPHPPPGIQQVVQAAPPAKQQQPVSAAPPSGQKRNFPDISVWVPSARAKQQQQQGQVKQQPATSVVYTSSGFQRQNAAVTTTTNAVDAAPRPSSAGERRVQGEMVGSAPEYSPFATPNYNVWQKRAELMQAQTGKRMDFASVAASGIKSVAHQQSQSSSFVVTAAHQGGAYGTGTQPHGAIVPSTVTSVSHPSTHYTNAPSNQSSAAVSAQSQGSTTPTSQAVAASPGAPSQSHRSPVPPLSQPGQAPHGQADAPEKAPGYRRGGAVTPIGSCSGSSSTTGGGAGGHQVSAETTPPSAASLSPPMASGTGTALGIDAVSFFQDPAIIGGIMGGTTVSKSAFSSPAGGGISAGFGEGRREARNLGFGLGGDHFSPISLPGAPTTEQQDRPASATPMLGTGGRMDSDGQFSLSSQSGEASMRLQGSLTPPSQRLTSISATSTPGGLELKHRHLAEAFDSGNHSMESTAQTLQRGAARYANANPTSVTSLGDGVKLLETSQGLVKVPATPSSSGWRGPPGGPDWSTASGEGMGSIMSAGNNGMTDFGSLSANLAKLQMDTTGEPQGGGMQELFGGAKTSVGSPDWMNPVSSLFGNPSLIPQHLHQPPIHTSANRHIMGGAPGAQHQQPFSGPGNQQMRGPPTGAGDFGMLFPPQNPGVTQPSGGMSGGGHQAFGWGGHPSGVHPGAPMFPNGGQENYDELFKHLAGNILSMYRNQQPVPTQHQFDQGLSGFPPPMVSGHHSRGPPGSFPPPAEAYGNHQQAAGQHHPHTMFNSMPPQHGGYQQTPPPPLLGSQVTAIPDHMGGPQQGFDHRFAMAQQQMGGGPPLGGWGDAFPPAPPPGQGTSGMMSGGQWGSMGAQQQPKTGPVMMNGQVTTPSSGLDWGAGWST